MINPPLAENRSANGFAIVATLSLLVLLTVILVGLLSLSSATLRNLSEEQATVEARANAQLALRLAIGELQKNTGADTRVTAPSSIIESGSPPIAGAWRSWEGLNHESGVDGKGRPIKPDYSIKNIDSTSADKRFLGWLVSGEKIDGDGFVSPQDLVSNIPATINGVDTVPLLADGSLEAGDTRQIHVLPVGNGTNGRHAWWVSPENQKALLQQPYSPRSNGVFDVADLAKSYSVADPAVFGLDTLLANPEDFGETDSSDSSVRKALTLRSIELLKPDTVEPQRKFHDVSTSAIGLLTNTATGGWRKDLSILTEKWVDVNNLYTNSDGAAALPLFRYSTAEGDTSAAVRPTVSNYAADQSNFYPWSVYSQLGANKLPLTYYTATASWESLVNFTKAYKFINYNSGTQTANASLGWTHNITEADNRYEISDEHFYRHYHGIMLNPIIARTQIIIEANALPDLDPYDKLGNPRNYHRVNLRVRPFFTLWNPYNVEITKTFNNPYDPEYGITALRSLPLALSITNDTSPPPDDNFKLLNSGRMNGADGDIGKNDTQIGGYNSLYYTGGVEDLYAWLPREFTLKPGEVKIFAPKSDPPPPPGGLIYYMNTALKEGFLAGEDYGIPLANPDNMSIALVTAPSPSNPDPPQRLADRFVKVPGRSNNQLISSDRVKFAVRADRKSRAFTDSVTSASGAGALIGVGTHHSSHATGGLAAFEAGKGNLRPNRFQSMQVMSVDTDWAEDYWPSNELVDVTKSVAEMTIENSNNPPWTPLFSISFGPRLSFGAGVITDEQNNQQNRPTKGLLQSNPFADAALSTPQKRPESHPVNSAYDISYHSFTDDSPYMPTPGDNANDHRGYIATGFQWGDGLSRIVMTELPLRPMASLTELQNWNMRGKNPYPPHQYGLIGNSDATPLIEKDSILPGSPITTDVGQNLQHDDAYCANHLLFDDWFFSSIAPEPTNFGANIARDIDTVYEDFLKGEDQLTNRAYQPIRQDRKLSATEASTLTRSILDSPDGDGWLKVASRFEVEGMFNVNSTSVESWRALLGHARGRQIAYHDDYLDNKGMSLIAGSNDYPVSRHTVAADVEAGDNPGLGAEFPSGSEYTGYRILNDDQLDELAEKVVEQVRLRGPFLSLSEFINRQLSSDENLALAGALQTALNNLSDANDPMAELKDTTNQLSSKTLDYNDPKLAEAGYAFEQSSVGVDTYGFPGYIRQADILRPIAPVLSARDDTFTIRAYGDKLDAQGNVVARAWCEAVVQRRREYVNPVDEADRVEPPANKVNQAFGRKYQIKSFRWLDRDEV